MPDNLFVNQIPIYSCNSIWNFKENIWVLRKHIWKLEEINHLNSLKSIKEIKFIIENIQQLP
jgi:hypothetical protein